MDHNPKKFTVSGTNIDEVKRKNADAGMSYNEAIEWMAKNTGGHGTATFSNTDVAEVKRQNQSVENNTK